MEEKKCTKCKTIKKVTEFHKSNKSKNGLQRHCKECQKMYAVNSSEKRIKYKADYYNKNKDSIHEKHRQYYKDNIESLIEKRSLKKDKIKIYNSEYRKRRSAIDPYFKFLIKFRANLCKKIKEFSGPNYVKSKKSKGIDYRAIYDKIGPRPDGNYHLDHIIPISKFDLTKSEHIILAHIPENLRWLPATQNLAKGSTIPDFVYDNDALRKVLNEIGILND